MKRTCQFDIVVYKWHGRTLASHSLEQRCFFPANLSYLDFLKRNKETNVTNILLYRQANNNNRAITIIISSFFLFRYIWTYELFFGSGDGTSINVSQKMVGLHAMLTASHLVRVLGKIWICHTKRLLVWAHEGNFFGCRGQGVLTEMRSPQWPSQSNIIWTCESGRACTRWMKARANSRSPDQKEIFIWNVRGACMRNGISPKWLLFSINTAFLCFYRCCCCFSLKRWRDTYYHNHRAWEKIASKN